MSLLPPKSHNFYLIIVHDPVYILDVAGGFKTEGFAEFEKTELVNFSRPVWLRTILSLEPKMIQVCKGGVFQSVVEFSLEAQSFGWFLIEHSIFSTVL